MSEERKIRNAIREIANAGNTAAFETYACTVTAVTGAMCDVQRILDEKEIKEVRLNATIQAAAGLLIVPKIGSVVLITNIDGDKNFVSQFSEIEKITLNVETAIEINGGTNGLVKIQELTDKLNALVQKYNGHTHSVSTSGSATSQTGTASATTDRADTFNKSDYEDTKILHS